MTSVSPIALEAPGIKKSWEAYKENAPAFLTISGIYVLVGLTELLISLAIYFLIFSIMDGDEAISSISRLISRVATFPLSFISQLSFAMLTVYLLVVAMMTLLHIS